jgi:serine/threonine protein kinase
MCTKFATTAAADTALTTPYYIHYCYYYYQDSREVYAVKSMLKEHMIIKNQITHVKAERDVMAEADNPWIVQLQYSFQDDVNLYMVMEYLPGGDLMGLLMKYDTFTEAATRVYMAETALVSQSAVELCITEL